MLTCACAIRGTSCIRTGLMDGTVFREVLDALKRETAADPALMLNGYPAINVTNALDQGEQRRQVNWAKQMHVTNFPHPLR